MKLIQQNLSTDIEVIPKPDPKYLLSIQSKIDC